MRKFFAEAAIPLILFVMTAAVLTGCNRNENKGGKDGFEVSELRYQGWTGRVLFAELAEDLGYLAPLKLNWVGNTISGPQDIQATASGDIHFGSAFTGSIVNLVKAKAPIRMVLASNGIDARSWNGFYILNESPIKSGRDLIGKKVAMNTIGAHTEFMLKEFLRREGLNSEEIRQVSLVAIPPLNGEQALRQKQVEVSTLGGVLKDKALERGGIRPLFSDYQLFGELSTSGLVMTEKFIRENPKTVRKLIEGTARAIDWAQTHPREEVIARMEKIIRQRGRNENTEPLKYWQSTGVAGKGGLIAEKEVQIWIDWLVKEGALKEDEVRASDVYTNEFNPYFATKVSTKKSAE